MAMLYGPQRRHAVASLGATAQAICLTQHFYAPNILVLIVRVLSQIQINACAIIHPTKSLFTLSLMLTMMNLASGLLHLLDFATGINGAKGIVLDFVGQSYPASLTRILLLDVLLYLIQLTGLCVSYVTHSTQLPRSSFFSYDDLLLPPTDNDESSAYQAALDYDIEEDEESGLNGTGGGARLRKRKGAAYEQVAGDEPDRDQERELWLDDDDGLGKPGSASTSGIRITEPPLIFSLPLKHIINLVFRLPAPLPPPRAFSGGTPQITPPFTPPSLSTAIPSSIPSTQTSTGAGSGIGAGSAGEGGTGQGGPETSSDVRRLGLGLRGMEDGSERSPADVGRIPGEYRTDGG